MLISEGNLKTNLSTKVADLLRSKILRCEILPNEHLNEVALASELGISRGPIRDAIKSLEMEGLVATPPNGRTIVVGFSEQDLVDFDEMRYYLESQAIKRVIGSADQVEDYDAWLSELEEIINKMKEYLYSNDELANYYDMSFHQSIMQRANNKINFRVWKSLVSIRVALMEINRQNLGQKELLSSEDFFDFHCRTLDGLRERNEELALNNLKEHTLWGTKMYLQVIRQIREK